MTYRKGILITDEKTPSILIVDDDPDLREVIAFDFEIKGFDVKTAPGGYEALKIIKEKQIDLVISDVQMPAGDGIFLLKELRKTNTTIPIIMFITGYTDFTPEEVYELGASAMFSKPFDREELFKTVNFALQPLKEKWTREHARLLVDYPATTDLSNDRASAQFRVKNIGRGGCYFEALEDKLPNVGETIEFEVETDLVELPTIKGTGIVRWNRKPDNSENLPPGCGIEFVELEPEISEKVIKLIFAKDPKQYIPRG